MKRYCIVLLAALLLICGGCTTQKNVTPVWQKSHFQTAFKTRTIQLIAPASGADLAKVKKLRTLQNLNIESPTNLTSDSIVFHANSDEARFALLKKALYDDSKDTVVWSLRGGYGSARIIDKLKKLPKPKHKKLVIGYSDITALHLFLSQHWQWQTIHGSGLLEILNPGKDPKNFEKIADIVDKRINTAEINQLKPLNDQALKSKKITGRLTGGNLSLIQTSIGTSWQIKAANKILFLEDVGEKGYKIDRALHHLKQRGLLKNVKAIVFGEFADSRDSYVNLALERFAAEINIPVFKSNQFGHGRKNYPLVYNAKTTIVPSATAKDFSLLMQINV